MRAVSGRLANYLFATIKFQPCLRQNLEIRPRGPKNGTTADAVAARLRESLLQSHEELEVDKIFRALVKLEGSDLHMKVGQPPMVRTRGELKALNRPPIDSEEMVRLLLPMMDERNLLIFEEEGGADFSHTIDVDGTRWRFRVNMLKSLGNIGLVARRISNFIPDFRGLFLPDSIERLCHFDQGMILLAGVTGSGKSTTIGSMRITSTASIANTF